MIKVIETNIYEEDVALPQSRVIEVESWDYIIEQFKSDTGIYKTHRDIYGKYYGAIRPKCIMVTKIAYNDEKLYCEFMAFGNKVVKKFIQRIGE